MVTSIEIIINPSIIVDCSITLLIMKDHAGLDNLDYAHSGHTGFASTLDLNSKVSSSDLFSGGKVKAELIPDEFDEVMEFAKQVSGVGYLTETILTDVGTIVWCAANKAICGEARYRKFLVNNDGTIAGITTISPALGKLYVGKTDNNLFKWTGSNLVEVSKSISLGETSTTAYAGNKGKANAQAIAELQNKRLALVGFYDSYDGSLNNLTFPTSQTQMIACGYKYDANSPIKGAFVPLFNDNTIELAPNNNGDYLKITTTTNNENTTITIDQSGMSYFRILVIETNIDLS